MRTAWIAIVALLAGPVIGVLGGCGEAHGYLEGERLVVDSCGSDGEAREFAPFRVEFSTFGVDPGKGPLYIRAQRHGEPLTGGDGFVIAVQDGDALRAWRESAPDTAFEFQVATLEDVALQSADEPPIVRGSLMLAGTCPDNFQSIEAASGTVTFEALGTEEGDRVTLRMDGLTFQDTRTGEVVGTGFAGEMDFVVHSGRPYRWHNP